MKKYLLLCLIALISSSLKAQIVKYFDADSAEISMEQFQTQRKIYTYLDVPLTQRGDTLMYQLIKRDLNGKLPVNDKDQLYAYLSDISGQSINKNMPVAILYHQGSDACNQSGDTTAEYRKQWYHTLSRKLNWKGKLNIVVLYSAADGVSRLYPDVKAYHDKNGAMKRFFKHRYPCGSVLILSPDARYAGYCGEYSKEGVVNIYQALLKDGGTSRRGKVEM